MTEIGYFLSSEEHDPLELLDQARLAEQHGLMGRMKSRPPPETM
jgi:hypothetical protein